MQHSYLYRRGAWYYFRMRVPSDLAALIQCRFLVKSLRTRYYSQAKKLLRSALFETERLFTTIRAGMLTDDQLANLIRTYKDKVLAGYQKHRDQGSDHYEAAISGEVFSLDLQQDMMEVLGKYDPSRTMRTIEQQVRANEAGIASRREMLGTGHFDDFARVRTFALAEKSGLPIDLPPREFTNPNEDAYFAKPPTEFIKLMRALLRTEIEILGIENARMRGEDTAYDQELRRQQERPQKTLAQACEIYQETQRQQDLAPKTLTKTRQSHRLLLQVLGDKPLRSIDEKAILDAAELLRKWPRNAYLHKEAEGLTAQEIITRADWGTPYKENSINYHLNALNTIFKFAVEKGWIDRSPCPRWKKTRARRRDTAEIHDDENRYLPWSRGEILRLLATSYFTEAKHRFRHAENFWGPLIALFSGMRQNEICMLFCDDLIQEPSNGIHYFRIVRNAARRQSVKTESSARHVPIHSTLIELGLLRYRDHLVQLGETRLFANLEYYPQEDNWSREYSKRFGKHTLRNMTWDNPDQRKVFHGFRSTFTRTLREDNSLLMEQYGYLTGHKPQHLMEAHYAGGAKIERLNEFLQALDYGIDFVSILGPWHAP